MGDPFPHLIDVNNASHALIFIRYLNDISKKYHLLSRDSFDGVGLLLNEFHLSMRAFNYSIILSLCFFLR